jgi:hypothetical protein
VLRVINRLGYLTGQLVIREKPLVGDTTDVKVDLATKTDSRKLEQQLGERTEVNFYLVAASPSYRTMVDVESHQNLMVKAAGFLGMKLGIQEAIESPLEFLKENFGSEELEWGLGGEYYPIRRALFKYNGTGMAGFRILPYTEHKFLMDVRPSEHQSCIIRPMDGKSSPLLAHVVYASAVVVAADDVKDKLTALNHWSAKLFETVIMPIQALPNLVGRSVRMVKHAEVGVIELNTLYSALLLDDLQLSYEEVVAKISRRLLELYSDVRPGVFLDFLTNMECVYGRLDSMGSLFKNTILMMTMKCLRVILAARRWNVAQDF